MPLFTVESDATLRSIVNSLIELSKHCLSVTIKWFLTWRTNQINVDAMNVMSSNAKAKLYVFF